MNKEKEHLATALDCTDSTMHSEKSNLSLLCTQNIHTLPPFPLFYSSIYVSVFLISSKAVVWLNGTTDKQKHIPPTMNTE